MQQQLSFWMPEVGEMVVRAEPWASWQYRVTRRTRAIASGQVWLYLDGATEPVRYEEVAPAPAPGDKVQVALKEFALWLQAVIDYGSVDPLVGKATEGFVREYHGALSTMGSWVYKTYTFAFAKDDRWAQIGGYRVPVNCIAKVPPRFWEC